jgi:hypothetical protein
MKKYLLIICLNIFFIAFLLVIFPSVAIHKRQGTSKDNGNHQISFIKKNPITFSFVSDKPNLQSLFVDMKNPGVSNNSKINFEISSPTSQRNIVFYGNNVGDPSSVPLKFSPFFDPPSTTYSVSLSTDNTDTQALYLITNQNSDPIFRSYYLQTDFNTNLQSNIQRQFEIFKQRSSIHNLIYIFSIIFLSLLIVLP